jgi:regulator of sigma E protease
MTIVLVIIGLSLIVLVHEAGHFLAAKLFKIRVDEFGFGFPPRLFARRIGETLYSVNALLFGGFVRIFGEEGEEKDPRAFNAQKVWRRVAVTSAGVIANVIGGWLILSVVFMVGAPVHLLLTSVAPGSPAAAAGLASGDAVWRAQAGGRVLGDPVGADNFVAMVQSAAREGTPVTLTVRGTGGAEREASLVPRANPPAGEGALGVGLAEVGVPQAPFFQSFVRGAGETWTLLKLIVMSLAEFFWNVFQRPETLREVAGPVGIAAASAAQASTFGFSYLLHFLGLISLNLAVLNLIPFPALDGGRVLFLLIEKAKGSPLPLRFERIMNTAGFALLILLMVVVTVQDIGRL